MNQFIKTSATQASDLRIRALCKEPKLTRLGITDGPEPLLSDLLEPSAIEEIAAANDWLTEQKLIKQFNVVNTSSGYAREVEAKFKLGGQTIPVSNGALIAAAIGAGMEYKIRDGSILLKIARNRPTARYHHT